MVKILHSTAGSTGSIPGVGGELRSSMLQGTAKKINKRNILKYMCVCVCIYV